MNETEKKETVRMFLDTFKVNSIDDLPEHALPNLLDMLLPDNGIGSVDTIYGECNEKEKRKLIVDIKKCINDNKTMSLYITSNEGVSNGKNNDYFDFCTRHSIWYEII